MCPKKSIQSLQKVSHSAAYLKAFENCYQMEKLHCSSENNTENQNKYFILIIINLKEYMFFFLLFIPLICFFSIFRKTERLSHISIRSFASKLIIFFFYFILEKLKILSRSTFWFKQHFLKIKSMLFCITSILSIKNLHIWKQSFRELKFFILIYIIKKNVNKITFYNFFQIN